MRRLPVGGDPIRVPEDLRGRLIVASPLIGDGNFDRSVLFIVEHNDEGALGVVINRPTETPVSDALPRWEDRLADPGVVFEGGPVGLSSVIALALTESADDEALSPVPGMAGVATVDLDSDPVITQAMVTTMRFFGGYAGWAPGQLEGEIGGGAWFVTKATIGDIFTATPHGLRESVLRRQRSGARAFTYYPEDPSLN